MVRSISLRALVVLGLLFWGQSLFAATDPQVLVKKTTDKVLAEIMVRKQELNKYPGRIYPLVNKILLPRFDFVRISRLVLGKHWKKATKSQKKAFIREFRELLVRTYATALLNYTGQEIVYRSSSTESNGKKAKVKTEIRDGGAQPVPLDYSLYLKGNSWKVYDLKIDGVSLVSTYRTNFASQIRRYKLNGLIANLKQRNSRDK